MKKKPVIIIATILVSVLGIGLGVYMVGQRQTLKTEAAPSTSLSVSPSTSTKAPGASVTYSVIANTGANQVTGVDLIINYNPAALQVDAITKGSGISGFDNEIRKTIDAAAGQIAYSAFTLDKTKAVTGSNLTILTITGKVKSTASAGTYNIGFGSGTAVAGLSEGQNLLTGSTPAVLTVSGSGPTPTPTIASFVGQTPTPQASATYIPTGSPTLQPIPETGTSWPTMGGLFLGGAVIVFSLLLAF